AVDGVAFDAAVDGEREPAQRRPPGRESPPGRRIESAARVEASALRANGDVDGQPGAGGDRAAAYRQLGDVRVSVVASSARPIVDHASGQDQRSNVEPPARAARARLALPGRA